ncbi:hypothetical protein PsorP6_017644 [Peronosclerospora sorghi]|uniref:Uncharacterized protein n=1 Tax=Peronosclerospora sorghi TaxID=230839 RepID=A0ACC0WP66_9STRA|nr:hypothetical protein PsorP6_017644 [Peronosclerospora sorghi]
MRHYKETILRTGYVSPEPHEISLRFLEHWGSEIVDPTKCTIGRAPTPDEGKQRKHVDSIKRFIAETDRLLLDAALTAIDHTTTRICVEDYPTLLASSFPNLQAQVDIFWNVLSGIGCVRHVMSRMFR